MAEVKKRAEMDPRYQWNTGDIFKTEADWEAALEAARGFLPQLQALQGRLGESGEQLAVYFRLSEQLRVALGQVYCYANLRADEDTAEAAGQERLARAQSLAVALSAADAFAAPEILAIPDDTLEGFYAATPELERCRVALDELRRRKAHVLSDREEALLAAAGEIAAGPYNVFSVFEGADLKFPDAVDSEGNAHAVTNGGFATLLLSPDRTLRENAFRSFYAVWDGMRNTAGALLNARMSAVIGEFFQTAATSRSPSMRTCWPPWTPTCRSCTNTWRCASGSWASTSCTCTTSTPRWCPRRTRRSPTPRRNLW